jgi:hypothetical protein
LPGATEKMSALPSALKSPAVTVVPSFSPPIRPEAVTE